MDETVRLMKKQLFWSRLTALLFAVMTVLLVIALILFGSFLRQAGDLVAKADQIAVQLDATASQLKDVDWESVGKNLETISNDLSAVDWLGLTEDISEMTAEAENSLQIAQKAITDLDIDTLNEAITELRDVIRPLANLVNRFSN
ncbi:MAG: hypothetical protein IKQ73_07650 [Oscillospiraceae bacterium]|nr:hypothetical protein [Oscillospiraceae bacterium]MCR5174587.1 hypothetical protein [Oscillospiraceae bacterium]